MLAAIKETYRKSLKAITSLPLTKTLKTPLMIGTLDMLTQPLKSVMFTGLLGNVLDEMVILLDDHINPYTDIAYFFRNMYYQ